MSGTDIPSKRPRRERKGGSGFHKNPLCPCSTCKSRRGRSEALALPAGDGGGSLATPADKINADLPVFVTRGHSARDRIASLVYYRATEPGITNVEVAKRLGIQAHTLNAYVTQAVKEGWLTFEDPLSRLEYELVPKVIDNLNHFLDARDKTVTIETAKGTIFKQFQEAKGLNQVQPSTVLAIKLELPDGGSTEIVSKVVGTPRTFDEEEAE